MLKVPTPKEIFIENQLKFDNLLSNFLDFFDLLCCRFCWIEDMKRRAKPIPEFKSWHTRGDLTRVLGTCRRFKKVYFQKWVNDTEHGFLHGFLTAFWTFNLLDSDTVRQFWEQLEVTHFDKFKYEDMTAAQLIAGCIFHDIVHAFTGNHNAHDEKLKVVFPNLPGYFYTHYSNPQDTSLPFIAADRTELMRFKDWRDWVRTKDLSKSIDFFGRDFLDHFYSWCRPALDRFVRYQDEVWHTHYPEHKIYVTYPEEFGVYPPSFYSDKKTTCYAVGSGKFSFFGCPNHYAFQPWMGCISRPDIIDAGCKVVECPSKLSARDHLFIDQTNGAIPIDRWVFLYKTTQSLREMLKLLDQSVIAFSFHSHRRLITSMRRFLNLVEDLCLLD